MLKLAVIVCLLVASQAFEVPAEEPDQLAVESREDVKVQEQVAAPAEVPASAAAPDADADPQRGLLKPLVLVGGAAALSSLLSSSTTTGTTATTLNSLLSSLSSIPTIQAGVTIPAGNVRSGLNSAFEPAYYYQPYPAAFLARDSTKEKQEAKQQEPQYAIVEISPDSEDKERLLLKPLILIGGAAALTSLLATSGTTTTTGTSLATLLNSIPSVQANAYINAGNVRSGLYPAYQPYVYQPYAAAPYPAQFFARRTGFEAPYHPSFYRFHQGPKAAQSFPEPQFA